MEKVTQAAKKATNSGISNGGRGTWKGRKKESRRTFKTLICMEL